MTELSEVAPPTKKHERMVKHIKKSYKKDGKLTDDEKSIAYATAWKDYNKDKVSEGASILKVRGKRNTSLVATGDHRRDKEGNIKASFYDKKPAPQGEKSGKRIGRKNKSARYGSQLHRLRPASERLGKKKVNEGSEHTQWSASIMLPSKRRKFVVVSCPSRDRKDAIQIIKALYGTDDIKQLNRIGLRVENIMRKIVRKYTKKKEEKKPQKDMSAGGRARRVLQRREYRDKVSSIIPKELEDQKNWKEFKKFLG